MTIPFKRLALAAAVGGLTAAAGAAQASSTVSYNTGLSAAGASSTYNGPDGDYTGSWSGGSAAPVFTGGLPANWYASFDSAGGTANLTSTAAVAAGAQELMVGPKAYRGDLSGAASSNWGHNSDFGLFHISAASDVTITLSSDNSLIGHTFADNATGGGAWVGGANTAVLAPGFSVWQGWDTGGGSRHGAYTHDGDILAFANNPLGTGATVIPGTLTAAGNCNGGGAACAYNTTMGSSSSISTATLLLSNLAPGDYTIFLGGYFGATAGPNEAAKHVAYTASIAAAPVSAVPIPAAAWLFASALTGLGVIGRRKDRGGPA